jgi:DNA-binding CsgD family transcriptional regulator
MSVVDRYSGAPLSDGEHIRWDCGCVVTEIQGTEQLADVTICDLHLNARNGSVPPPPMPVTALRWIDRATGGVPHFFLVDRDMHLVGASAAEQILEYLPLALAALAPYAGRAVPDLVDLGKECRLRIVQLGNDAFSSTMIVFVQTPRLGSALRYAAEAYGLTERELAVLRLTAETLSNIEIAHKLCIAPSTVADHMQSLFRKMDCTRRTQMVRILFAY